MIVLTLPRCGATKFCMDLSEKTGLPFVGEMTPNVITEFEPLDAARKIVFHETNHDEFHSIDDYIHIIENMDKYIIQANASNHFLLPHADIFLLRKNINNIIFSYGNLAAKAYPHEPTDQIVRWMSSIRNSIRLIYTYVYKKGIEPVWYEDYFNNHPCLTPELDALPGIDQYKQEIYDLNLNLLSQQILNRN